MTFLTIIYIIIVAKAIGMLFVSMIKKHSKFAILSPFAKLFEFLVSDLIYFFVNNFIELISTILLEIDPVLYTTSCPYLQCFFSFTQTYKNK